MNANDIAAVIYEGAWMFNEEVREKACEIVQGQSNQDKNYFTLQYENINGIRQCFKITIEEVKGFE